MPSLAAIRSANAAVKLPKTRSLVVGGTSGIGEAIARRLALAGSHVTIVGRNKEAGNSIVKSIKQASEKVGGDAGDASFVPLDVSLIRNVKKFGQEFIEKEQRLDYLAITAGIGRIQGRVENEEGIDEKMSIHYYMRYVDIRLGCTGVILSSLSRSLIH
jgi:NAD(P)-dependent dehydrogenase (short-subunit alcohol dehydrogenase family)